MMPDLQTLSVDSAIFAETRSAPVYLPPGYSPANRYPTIYCSPGPLHFGRGLPEWLDEQISSGALAPCLVVGIPNGEHDEEADFYRFAATELLPAVEASYAASPLREDRWLMGYSGGAGYMIELGAAYGDRFGKVAAQAPGWMFWSAERNEMISCYLEESIDRIRATSQVTLPDFWFVWGDENGGFEERARLNGMVMIRMLRQLGAGVEQSTIPGGHGIAAMKQGWPLSLRFLQRELTRRTPS